MTGVTYMRIYKKIVFSKGIERLWHISSDKRLPFLSVISVSIIYGIVTRGLDLEYEVIYYNYLQKLTKINHNITKNDDY